MRGPTSSKRALRFVLLFGVAAVGLYAIRPHGPLECGFRDLVGFESGAAAWSLGTFPTEAAGMRASVQTIARELAHCPGRKIYRVWWSEATDSGTLKVATLYLREYNMIGLERDPYSGIQGTVYTADDSALTAVAAKQGTLRDFRRQESGRVVPPAQPAYMDSSRL
jgi:hypothetical protein